MTHLVLKNFDLFDIYDKYHKWSELVSPQVYNQIAKKEENENSDEEMITNPKETDVVSFILIKTNLYALILWLAIYAITIPISAPVLVQLVLMTILVINALTHST